MPQQTLLESVAVAIKAAQTARAYGLYDYKDRGDSEDKPPYVIRDELAPEHGIIARFDDYGEAKDHYDRLCREFVARAAIAAVNKWMADEFVERQSRMGLT